VRWYFPQPRDVQATLRLGLDLARRFLPEALPIRYGPWEPLPYRYSNDEAFIDSVLAEDRGAGSGPEDRCLFLIS